MGNSHSTSRHAPFPDFERRYKHIEDPNQRLAAVLQEIDERRFGRAQLRAILVAGTGFLTDSYDIFVINLVTNMIGFCYFPNNCNRITESSDTAIKVVTSAGTLLGQLFFGWLADRVGRKRMYGYELLIITLATLGQCITGPSSAIGITGLLVFWRIIMGLGIGGDYPLSSVITSEFANTKWRGAMMASVFAAQALGQFLASLVALIVTAIFKKETDTVLNQYEGDKCVQTVSGHLAVDRMWRIIVGFGAVPAVIALYCRLTIPETPRYTFHVNRDVEQGFADYKAWVQDSIGPRHGHGCVAPDRENIRAGLNSLPDRGLNEQEVPRASWQDFSKHFGQWKNLRVLVGTAGSWFFLDAAYYALALNNTIFLQKLGYGGFEKGKKYTIYALLQNGAVGNLILVCAGSIPGSLLTIYFVDRIGRKPIQIGGFAIVTVLLLILGSAFNDMSDRSRVALFVLCLFFFDFGPNATTFIVPGECFPTRYRSTCHGISSASGKLGAVLAQSLTGPLRNIGFVKGTTDTSPWLPHVIQILSGFTFLGFLVSFLIPETMGMTLEQLAKGQTGETNPWLRKLKFSKKFKCQRLDTAARDSPPSTMEPPVDGSELNRIQNGEGTAPQGNIEPSERDPGRQPPD